MLTFYIDDCGYEAPPHSSCKQLYEVAAVDPVYALYCGEIMLPFDDSLVADSGLSNECKLCKKGRRLIKKYYYSFGWTDEAFVHYVSNKVCVRIATADEYLDAAADSCGEYEQGYYEVEDDVSNYPTDSLMYKYLNERGSFFIERFQNRGESRYFIGYFDDKYEDRMAVTSLSTDDSYKKYCYVEWSEAIH